MFRIAFLILSVSSLYEDQVGTYDWHKQNLGQISEISLLLRGKSLALSARGVLSVLMSSGQIEWRRIVNSLDSSVIMASSLTDVYTHSEQVLTAWAIDDGLVLWTKPCTSFKQLFLTKIAANDVLLGLTHNEVYFFSAIDGEEIRKVEVKNAEKIIARIAEDIIVLADNFEVFKIEVKTGKLVNISGQFSGKVVCAKETCIGIKENTAKVYLNGEIRTIDWNLGEVSHALNNFFVLTDNTLVEISDFQIVTKKVLPAHVPSLISTMWAVHSSNEIRIERLGQSPISLQGSLPPILKFWGYSNDKGDVFGYLLLEDFRTICFSGNSIRWVREESLGHIHSVHFMELPSKEMHAHNQYFSYIKSHDTWADVFNNFVLRVQSQVSTPSHEIDVLEKDSFALKKIILAVSHSGYILALQSLNSEVVWRLKISNVKAIIQTNPEEALIISVQNAATNLFYLDIISGRVISSKVFDVTTLEVLQTGDDENLNIYLIDDSFKVHPISVSRPSAIYYYIIDSSKNSIEGFSHNATTVKTWSIKVSSSEKIVNFITNRSGKIHQPAIATGTSRLIYKYADENLFAISTQKNTELFVYVINSISGHIIYRMHQDSISGPVHMEFHEHKLYVHYWNSRFERFEIVSIELFRSKVDDSASDVVKPYYLNKYSLEYSSQFTPELTVFTQTYVFPYGIKDMKITTTLQGITKPALAMILDSSQVYLLDTQYLSPRRKLEDSHEEGLFDDPSLPVYKPNLPWSAVNVASYYLDLQGLAHIRTTVTWLESTSILVAFGLDLFSVRVMPEKSFDLLGEDFSKSAMVVTIAGLFVLNLVVQRWFSLKNSKEKFNT